MSTQAAETPLSEPQIPVKTRDAELLARLVVREGKSFKSSALLAGYSSSTACLGAKALCDRSSIVAEAFKRESEAMYVGLDKLKPLAVKRLHDEIINPRSANGMKAIELAGRFKETDWWVRNSDVNVGVFMGLGEAPPEAADAVIEAYEPEK